LRLHGINPLGAGEIPAAAAGAKIMNLFARARRSLQLAALANSLFWLSSTPTLQHPPCTLCARQRRDARRLLLMRKSEKTLMGLRKCSQRERF